MKMVDILVCLIVACRESLLHLSRTQAFLEFHFQTMPDLTSAVLR